YIIFVSSHNDLIHDSYNLRAYYFIRKTNYKTDLNIFYSIVDQELYNNDIFIDLNYKLSKTQISLNQIIYLESQNHKIKVDTVNGTYFDNRTLKVWTQLLPDDKFIQVHRSFIINIEHLISYRKGHLIMTNNEDLIIGRVYKNKFDQFYQEYLLK
uniref:LytR/AlgR family response regulator transcription factor n=1 Tax=uncultured Thomasclavelia sp. TaxID=3025759 RepID=UPI0025FE477F